jgi:tRNA (mo5U34)-methyltransferase
MRCLDVGTRDGFWAFEMERRGASEVVGIDLDDWRRYDWPGGAPPALDGTRLAGLEARSRAFETAARALGSAVRREDLSIYELSPEAVGEFDFVYLGTLLLHLRDPVGALMSVRSVIRGAGELLVNEVVSLPLSVFRRRPLAELVGVGSPFWWACNAAGLRRLIESAGFTVIASGRPYFEPSGRSDQAAPPNRGLALRQRLHREVLRRLGASHAWVRATPAG